ncbi:hypothetical protein TWF192_000942 [Orbilia oligospora]|uniref:Uncharacterized protein n=1 Tax=Orbilia oligospora TaxID=2813651 RepID=A0A6G1MG54_ORBOL|nr:hypothetical protein TWF191_005569 [Orbilia oligospora]KAF3257652.1 hypothetical protein TWF192_000942 [Orbilia oligospora]
MVSPRCHFISFLILLGSQCIQPVKCAPVRDTKGREDAVARSQRGFVLSQTGIRCSIPFDFRKKIPLDDQPHSKLGLPEQDLQTYHSKNVSARILKRLENLKCHTELADCTRGDLNSSLHSCDLKYQYGCLCLGYTQSRQGYENPKLQIQASTQEISIEENQLGVHISDRFHAFNQDEHLLATTSSDIDSICQWYAISIDEKTSQVQANSLKGLHDSSNESPYSPQVTEVSLELPSSSQRHKMKRDISTPSFVNSSTTTTSLRAPPVAGPTIEIANTSRNKITPPPPPLLEAANNSSTLEARVGGLPSRGGLIATEVYVRCASTDTILSRFTPSFYHQMGLSRFPNWQSEIRVSSREEVIEFLQKKIDDCGACECKTEEDVRGGFWGLVPNRVNVALADVTDRPEECASEEAAKWCQQVLGCYCEEVADLGDKLTAGNRYLLHRIGPGRYLRGTREHVGLSLTNIYGLTDFFEERSNRLPTVDPDGPPPLPPRPVPNPIPPPLPPRPNVPQTFEVVDPQEPEEAPIVLEGPEPPDYHNEMLPDYALLDPGAVIADEAAPPGYVFQDPEAETRRRRSRMWNGFLAGAGALGDRFFGGRARGRFRGGRGGGSGPINLGRRDVKTNARERDPLS